jgi:hypothetical protein
MQAFTRDDPIRLLAHNLDFWLPAVTATIQDQLREFPEVDKGKDPSELGVPVTLLTYDQRALGSLAAGLLMSRLQGTSPDPPRRIVLPVRAVTLNTSGSEQ